jgi:hypothetical protein
MEDKEIFAKICLLLWNLLSSNNTSNPCLLNTRGCFILIICLSDVVGWRLLQIELPNGTEKPVHFATHKLASKAAGSWQPWQPLLLPFWLHTLLIMHQEG